MVVCKGRYCMGRNNFLDVSQHTLFSQNFKQQLSKDDFNVLAVNIIDSDNKITDDTRIRGNSWINSLTQLEKEVSTRHSSLIENAIVFLSYPLLKKSVNVLVYKSFIKEKDFLHNNVFYAGFLGMCKGIRKYNAVKDTGKSIHYIMRWFNVYAGRELSRNEASELGINYTHYEKLKKIAAVRIKLANDLQRNPRNSEVLDYFHSGKADMKKGNTVSKSNLAITLEDIIEQERVYKSYFIDMIDNT